MSFFEWDARYELDVESMDDEHKVLIAKMNRTYDLVARQAAQSECLEALDDFIAYTSTHFADEEKFMQRMAYPQFDMHRSLHQSLIGNLEQFREEMRKGALVERELFEFLARWLKGHIVGVDKSYASFSRSATSMTR